MAIPQPTLDQVVDESVSIKKVHFKILVGIVAGLAFLSVIGRIGVRYKTKRRLALDDWMHFTAAIFLAAATGVVFNFCDGLYLSNAIQKDFSVVFRLSSEQLQDIIDHATAKNAVIIVLSWNAIFFVKFSFLAFFRGLTEKIDDMQIYFWTVVGFTCLSWAFLVSEPFILCPYFGFESIMCFDHSKDLLYVAMTGLVTALDGLSDLLIIFIPVMILRCIKVSTFQKVGLGACLCLSIFMIVAAVIRASKIHGASGIDAPWEIFWQFVEACIAVFVGSVPTFRTLFGESSKKSAADPRQRSTWGRPTWSWARSRRNLKKRDILPSVSIEGGTLNTVREQFDLAKTSRGSFEETTWTENEHTLHGRSSNSNSGSATPNFITTTLDSAV